MRKRSKPVKLLTGGNPQIAKANGDAPVQTYIAAMPGWKHAVGLRLDTLVARTVPGVRKAVKEGGCTRAIVVAHNAAFDHQFIMSGANRNSIKRNPFHPFSFIDTASLAAVAYGQTVLSQACSRAGIAYDSNEAHSARYDAEVTAQLFCAIVNRWQDMGGWPPPE